MNYYGEPGAVNEGIGDIIGKVIENNVEGGSVNWTLGHDIADYHIERSMSDPTSMPQYYECSAMGITLQAQPAIYYGTNWYHGTAGKGGLWINEGVMNKWFYLLVNGGTSNGVTVNYIGSPPFYWAQWGIGIDEAAEIVKNMTLHGLSSTSGYYDAVQASMDIAYDKYGPCSPELTMVKLAWQAVGLGGATATVNPLCTTIYGPTYICEDGNEDGNYWTVSNYNAAYFPPIILKGVSTYTSGTIYTWSWSLSDYVAIPFGTGDQYLFVKTILTHSAGIHPINVTATNGSLIAYASFPFDISICDDKKDIKHDSLLSNPITGIYPNPTSGRININLTNVDIMGTLRVFDLQGRCFQLRTITSVNDKLDLGYLANGSYIINIENKYGLHKNYIIILRKE